MVIFYLSGLRMTRISRGDFLGGLARDAASNLDCPDTHEQRNPDHFLNQHLDQKDLPV